METKSIFLSVTFWGVVVAVTAQVAKRYGVEIDEAGTTNDVMSLVAAFAAMYGRYRATTAVTLTGAPK